jgi:hypothetical protein
MCTRASAAGDAMPALLRQQNSKQTEESDLHGDAAADIVARRSLLLCSESRECSSVQDYHVGRGLNAAM